MQTGSLSVAEAKLINDWLINGVALMRQKSLVTKLIFIGVVWSVVQGEIPTSDSSWLAALLPSATKGFWEACLAILLVSFGMLVFKLHNRRSLRIAKCLMGKLWDLDYEAKVFLLFASKGRLSLAVLNHNLPNYPSLSSWEGWQFIPKICLKGGAP